MVFNTIQCKMQDFLRKLTTKQKIIIIVIFIILALILFIFAYKYFYIDNGPQNIIEISQNEKNNEIENTNDVIDENDSFLSTNKKKGKIAVHVIGEVNKPGVVKLNEGDRIIDAIKEAGGQTENADLSKVNLAYIVEDGTQIYIPKYSDNLEDISLIREDAGEGIVKQSAINDEGNNLDTKVNINTATKEKLVTLPGIGESMADKIISYRNQNGKFENIEDIKKVNGIGESKFNNIKDRITVK